MSIHELIKELNIPFDLSTGDISFTNSLLLSNLLSYVTEDLKKFYNLDSSVSLIKNDADSLSFYIEISGFLREFGCPYTKLLEGPLESRFSTEDNIQLLLTFLLTELMSAKVTAVEHTDSDSLAKARVDITDNNSTSLTLIMKPSLMLLGVGRPPDSMTVALFFAKLEKILNEKLPSIPEYFMGKSLMSSYIKPLNEEQWQKVDLLINSVNADYDHRRRTIIQRFDVTVQSFKWSPKAVNVMEKIIKAYTPAREIMEKRCIVTLVDLLAARDYPLTLITEACSGAAREKTKSKLNRIIIGKVPDRGGRPCEMEAPPPEVPAFQKRDASNQQSNSGGRGGGYNNANGNRGGYQPQSGNRGGYQPQGGSRDGYQPQSGNRGGYQPQSGNRGGYQPQSGNRGGYQNQEVYHNNKGGYPADNRGRMTGHTYQDQPDRYAQSVAPNNFYYQNESSLNFTPQYQSQGSNQSGNYRYGNEDGKRGQRY